jgi:hypothetical protein
MENEKITRESSNASCRISIAYGGKIPHKHGR